MRDDGVNVGMALLAVVEDCLLENRQGSHATVGLERPPSMGIGFKIAERVASIYNGGQFEPHEANEETIPIGAEEARANRSANCEMPYSPLILRM